MPCQGIRKGKKKKKGKTNLSVIIICNSAYIFTFNCYVQLHFWEGVFVFLGMNVLWLFLACESLHACTVCIWHCDHARFCMEVFLCAVYKFSFIHSKPVSLWLRKKGVARNMCMFCFVPLKSVFFLTLCVSRSKKNTKENHATVLF